MKTNTLKSKLKSHCIGYTHGWKSRGGGDVSPPPPTILKVGDTISNVPPPHVFVVGRWIFNQICLIFFFFFFACQNVGVGPTGTPNLSLKNCQRRWRCGKKKSFGVPPPPPPRSSAFLGVARLWAGGGEKKNYVPPPPPIIRFGFATRPPSLCYTYTTSAPGRLAMKSVLFSRTTRYLLGTISIDNNDRNHWLTLLAKCVI